MTTETTITKTDVKTIDVNSLEWFDKINGNSYFAGRIIINYAMDNEKRFLMPFQYGYGGQDEQEAKAELLRAGLIPETIGYYSLSTYCKENGIIYRHTKTDRCKKAELKAIDKLVYSKK